MCNKYFQGKIINKNCSEEIDKKIIDLMNSLSEKVDSKMENYEVSAAIDEIFGLLRSSNKYIDETMPWVLAKDSEKQDRLMTVLYNLLESIRIAAILLKPYIPDTSSKIIDQLNNNRLDINFVLDNTYEVTEPIKLFERINKEEFIDNINCK